MKKGLTELVFIIDCSGSMHGLEADTIGGFNSMLQKQKAVKGHAYVSTVLFNGEIKVIHDRESLNKVEPMTKHQYQVGGCTALLDAIGSAIHHIGNVHKYARKTDIPEKTLFVIITDGMENCSHRYSAKRVREMINHEKEKYGWEFLFLGANIDAVSTAKDMGINEDRAVTFCCDEKGTALNYESIGRAVQSLRECNAIPSSWKSDIEDDERRRGRKNRL